MSDMGNADVIDSTAVAIRDPASLQLVPPGTATELVERLGVIREAMQTAMLENVDYGHIPGTDKPALLKPGAEKLGVLFQLDVQLENEKLWGPDQHLTVMSRATVFHAPSGTRLGFGEGLCTTREKKYAYRKQERVCPTCGVAAVIKGKAEYGGGWLCWKRRDGCGAKFPDGDASVEGQEVGQIDNPDLPDAWNTVVKMAEKRARVDAVLSVTGASALFTQDVEADDQPREAEQPAVDRSDYQPPPDGRMDPLVREELFSALSMTANPAQLLVGLGVSTRPKEWLAVDELKIRSILAGSGDIPSDVPDAPESDADLQALADEVFGVGQAVVE